MVYRKRPVEVEAEEWEASIESEEKMMEFMGLSELEVDDTEDCMYIYTLEGRMRADLGDFIIKGVKGEFYPCKADIFHLTYEKV